MFWTDSRQASERLANSIVMYDGKPLYIERVTAGEEFEDGEPRAVTMSCDGTSTRKRKKLSSPKFKNFRELPPLGFCILKEHGNLCVFTQRIVTQTRTHGLSTRNVQTSSFTPRKTGKGDLFSLRTDTVDFSSVMFDPGFHNSCRNDFPSLESILTNIQERTALPYGHNFAVYRDTVGVRWLYRKKDRVGFFSGADTLVLLPKKAHFREEIQEDPNFTLNNIKEY